MVNIWHPDRFSSNPRLKQKAENKLKEINEAYEAMQSFCLQKNLMDHKRTSTERLRQPKTLGQIQVGNQTFIKPRKRLEQRIKQRPF